jgi:hypothetical protein
MGMKTFMTSTQGLIQLGFVIGLGLVILSSALNTFTGGGATALVRVSDRTTLNTSVGEAISGVAEFTGWVGLIVLIIVGAFLFRKMNFGGGK